MTLLKTIKHLESQADNDAWFQRTVELPSVATLLDANLKLSEDNERLRGENRKANFTSAALSLLFLFFMIWKAHNV